MKIVDCCPNKNKKKERNLQSKDFCKTNKKTSRNKYLEYLALWLAMAKYKPPSSNFQLSQCGLRGQRMTQLPPPPPLLWACPDCARKMLEGCQLECQKLLKIVANPKSCCQNFKSCHQYFAKVIKS